jgi:hypothetical protein
MFFLKSVTILINLRLTVFCFIKNSKIQQVLELTNKTCYYFNFCKYCWKENDNINYSASVDTASAESQNEIQPML